VQAASAKTAAIDKMMGITFVRFFRKSVIVQASLWCA
jgi:hypothetical protein